MCFYAALAALSIYLIMQTMEAVIFRTLELVVPCWVAWQWAAREPRERVRRDVRPRRISPAIAQEEVQHA